MCVVCGCGKAPHSKLWKMCWSNLHNCPDHTTDICLYVPFCIVFVVLGSVQVVSGIFYFISIPVIKLIINIGIGCWVILTGIGTGMVSCICSSSPRKHELLLYCSVSVLILNTINIIYLEFGQVKELFSEHVQSRFGKEYDLIDSQNGRILTTVTALVLIIVSFIESQVNFYLLNKSQIARKKQRSVERKNRQLYVVNDQSADLEYVIPKKVDLHHQKSVSDEQKTVQVHNKSWVFEATGDDEYDPNIDESSVSLCSSISPTHSHHDTNHSSHQQNLQFNQSNGHTASVSNGKHQRRLSRVSDAASERFAPQMSSFSRCATPSPVPRSGQQTPTNGGGVFSPYSDHLDTSTASSRPTNRLTVDFLSSAPKLKPVTTNNYHDNHDPSSLTTQPDDSPYASLLAELEQSLQEKKIQSSFSPDNTSLSTSDNKFGSDSKSSSKDLEFSKELEAALQLIQELETPSEGPFLGDVKPRHTPQTLARSDSEKTLSAAVSLPSPEAGPLVDTTSPPPLPSSDSAHKLVINVRAAAPSSTFAQSSSQSQNGKHIFSVFCNEPGSQSTSGYSSPSSSNLNSMRDYESSETSCGSDRTLNSFGGTGDMHHPGMQHCHTTSFSTVSHHNPYQPMFINTLDPARQRLPGASPSDFCNPIALTSSAASRSNHSANKSFLLFKKRSKLMPQPDFQSRIFKSECLAYLTEEELVQRHQLNRNVIRKIELNVARRVKGCQPNDISHTIN